MEIISGSSNPELAKQIAHELQMPMIDIEITKFSNGEKRVWIKDEVKGENVVIVQSFSEPTDEHIMEFLLIADALERCGARHINLVLPWMGYSLQDKVFRDGEPIAAKVVANLVSTAHIKRVFLLDLHNSSTPGFFSIPTQHLSAMDVFTKYAQENFDLQNAVVASPDFGGLKRARVFANKLGTDLVRIDKHRDLTTGETSAMGLQGDVNGKSVIIFDDIINTGSTVNTTVSFLREKGAKEVHFWAAHGIFANDGIKRVSESGVDSVLVTNSIAQPSESGKVKTLDIAPLFAQALKAWA